jgi:hypothetical protein
MHEAGVTQFVDWSLGAFTLPDLHQSPPCQETWNVSRLQEQMALFRWDLSEYQGRYLKKVILTY